MVYLLIATFVLGCSNVADAAAQDSASTGGDNGHGDGHPEEVLFFLFGTIAVGTCVLHATTIPALQAVPVTVLLFVLGVVFALLVEYDCLTPFGKLTRSYDAWVAIDPHLLLFTFLPALLCGDAMTIDTHIAKRTVGQCLILAGPGVVMGSFATAALVYGMLPYGWDFWTSLTVGSILAATDPVAVVSLLKDLGASPVLTMQIQGESLLNDGTAMVLFRIAYDLVSGEEYSAGRVIGFLFSSTLGAAALGVAIGLVFYLWIRTASDRLNHSSPIIQISLTLLCAYWSFIFAEGVLHISGVLSTVAAAFVLAHMMWPVVVEHRSMLEIWHVIETIGNTMVFFLAGVLTGRSMIKSSFVDYLWTVLMYVLMNVLRFVMLLILKPLLDRAGSTVSLADICVMTWGGLRGMVGLALAILVRQDLAKGNLKDQDGDRILFLVSGIAALTLVVNATTSPALCMSLGITQAPECRKVLMRNVARRAEGHATALLEDLAADKQRSQVVMTGFVQEAMNKIVEHVNHHLPALEHTVKTQPTTPALTSTPVMSLVPSEPVSDERSMGMSMGRRLSVGSWTQWLQKKTSNPRAEDLWSAFEAKRTQLLRTGAPVEVFQFGKQLENMKDILGQVAVDKQQLKMVREVFLEAVRASYWEQLKQGRFLVGGSEPALLLNSVNLAKDKCGTGLEDWESLKPEVEVPDDTDELKSSGTRANLDTSSFALLNWLKKQYREWRIQRHFSRQTKGVHVIDAFIQAHRKAQAQIASYFGDDASVDTAEEVWVVIESQIMVYEAAIARSKISRMLQVKVNTMWQVHLVAEEYRNFVLGAHESGILGAKEAETVLHPLAQVMHNVERDRKHIKQALQQDLKMRRKTGSSKLTPVDAACRIQRTFRAKRQHLKMQRAMQQRKSFVQKSHLDLSSLRVRDADADDDSTVSGEDLCAVPIPEAGSTDTFMAVLPHTPDS